MEEHSLTHKQKFPICGADVSFSGNECIMLSIIRMTSAINMHLKTHVCSIFTKQSFYFKFDSPHRFAYKENTDFIHLSILQMFIRQLPCARHYSRDSGYNNRVRKRQNSCLHKIYILIRKNTPINR